MKSCLEGIAVSNKESLERFAALKKARAWEKGQKPMLCNLAYRDKERDWKRGKMNEYLWLYEG